MQETLLQSLGQEDPRWEWLLTSVLLPGENSMNRGVRFSTVYGFARVEDNWAANTYFTSSSIGQIKICCNCGIRERSWRRKTNGLYSIQKLAWLPAHSSLPVEIMWLTPLSEMIRPREMHLPGVYRRPFLKVYRDLTPPEVTNLRTPKCCEPWLPGSFFNSSIYLKYPK